MSELLTGIATLPEGKRRHGLETKVSVIETLFGVRVLPFDSQAAAA